MASESLIKIRALALVTLAIVLYPLLILVVILSKVLRLTLAKNKLKSIVGEIAVVTGAANGLGKELAIELAKKRCHVAIVDVDFEKAKETAKLINDKYRVKAKAYQVDVSNYEEVEKLNEAVMKDFGPTTILINNAGIVVFSNLLDPDCREIQNMINVNLTAHIWTNRVFLPKMKEMKKGHIVAISSAAGMYPMSHYGVYSSTKFGVRGLMRSLSLQLKSEKFEDIHTTTAFPLFLQTNDRVVEIARKTKQHEFYPIISGEEAAQDIVRAILANKQEIMMPRFLAIYYRMLENLPADWRDWLLVAVSPGVNKLRENTKPQSNKDE